MCNRQHVAVDDEPDEVHNAVGGCQYLAARRDIDAAMTSRIRSRGSNVLPHNPVFACDRPRPVAQLHGR